MLKNQSLVEQVKMQIRMIAKTYKEQVWEDTAVSLKLCFKITPTTIMQGFKTKINMELELLVDLLVSMEVATLFSESSRQAYRFPLRAKKDLISIMETFKEFKTASSKLLAVYKPILTKINSLNTDPSLLSRKDLPVKEGT